MSNTEITSIDRPSPSQTARPKVRVSLFDAEFALIAAPSRGDDSGNWQASTADGGFAGFLGRIEERACEAFDVENAIAVGMGTTASLSDLF